MLVAGRTRLVTVTAFSLIAFIAIAALTYNPELTDDSSNYLRKSWSKISSEQAWLGAGNAPTPPGNIVPNPQTPQEALPFHPEPQLSEPELPSKNPNPYAAVNEVTGGDATDETTTSSSSSSTLSTSTTTAAAAELPTETSATTEHKQRPAIPAENAKEYDEITSQSTADGGYFNINFFGNDNGGAFNPSILPHAQLFDTWIVTAQARYDDRPFPSGWSAELVCNANFTAGGNLSCIDPPTVLTVAATQSTHCKDKLLTLHMNIGPHDARAVFGPDYPYLVYGSQSEHTCFGIWTQDFRLLMDWGIFRGWDAFQVPTEIQRPPPLGAMEKNYYMFWDFDKVFYAHYDTAPKRAFAKLELDGSAGADLAPQVYAQDGACFDKHLKLNPLPDPSVTKSSIHQATNSLSLTFCYRNDTSCIPNADNTYVIAIYQHKVGNGVMHARYEPYVMVFKRRAPFEIVGISAKPLWIRGRSSKDEMLYATSINWKKRGMTYDGYLDDVVHLNFGVEDHRTASIDVLGEDLVRNLMMCDGQKDLMPVAPATGAGVGATPPLGMGGM